MPSDVVPAKKCGNCLMPMAAQPELFVKGFVFAVCKDCWLRALPK